MSAMVFFGAILRHGNDDPRPPLTVPGADIMKKTLFTLLLMMVAIALAILFRAHNQDLLLQGEVDAPK